MENHTIKPSTTEKESAPTGAGHLDLPRCIYLLYFRILNVYINLETQVEKPSHLSKRNIDFKLHHIILFVISSVFFFLNMQYDMFSNSFLFMLKPISFSYAEP